MEDFTPSSLENLSPSVIHTLFYSVIIFFFFFQPLMDFLQLSPMFFFYLFLFCYTAMLHVLLNKVEVYPIFFKKIIIIYFIPIFNYKNIKFIILLIKTNLTWFVTYFSLKKKHNKSYYPNVMFFTWILIFWKVFKIKRKRVSVKRNSLFPFELSHSKNKIK